MWAGRRMKAWMLVGLGTLALSCAAQPRLTVRALADVATIRVPAALDSEDASGGRVAEARRLAFGFSSTDLWASMGSVTAYRQQLVVSLMPPDATEADYAEWPRRMDIHHDQHKLLGSRALGPGTLTTTEGLYTMGSAVQPAWQFLYADRNQRLQLAWHVLKKEMDLASATAQLPRMAASFRIVRDPVERFAAMRDAPRQEAEHQAKRLATVQAMLKREGYAALVPGQPVLRRGVYLEWMSDPEPRYQLLLPLGRVRAAPEGAVTLRPRPRASAARAGPLGWREVVDGDWVFDNIGKDYLPFQGIAARLAAQQQDRGYVYFYYAATVRVEEESAPDRLNSLAWFFDAVPDVQRRWREGALVAPGVPEKD